MEDHFSKFRLTPSIAELRTSLPVLALPARKNIPKHISILNNGRIPGIILIFFMFLLSISMIISGQQTKRNMTQSALISQLQIHHLWLAPPIQQALGGDATAFTQLHENQQQLNQTITLLSQGGIYRDEKIVPITEHALSLNLEAYHNNWLPETKKIDLILSHKESLLKLSSSMRAINIIQSQLARRIDELINRMTEIGNLSQQMRTMEAIRMHARNIARNIKTIFPNESPLAEITTQLIQDRAQISEIIQSLSQGNNGLGSASDKDETIQDLLSHIHSLLRKFDDHMHIVQKEIPLATAAQLASHQIADKNEVMLDTIKELDHQMQEQVMHTAFLLNSLIYALSAGLAIVSILFIRSLRPNSRSSRQELISKSEIEKAQKAIQVLLNDMKKIADGNLTVRTDITNHMTGAIADAINFTIEELHTLVEQVNQASALVVQASNQAQHVSSELLTAAQQQSAKIEETTCSISSRACPAASERFAPFATPSVLLSIAAMASWVSPCIVRINSLICLLASADRSARRCTSWAITVNPRPASPAAVAWSAAFKARTLV